MVDQQMVGDEDCLYLNVYTPVLDKDARKAVMVWFHSGAFNAGLGDELLYGPDFLIEKDVVLVTLNYRLGPLGAYRLDDPFDPISPLQREIDDLTIESVAGFAYMRGRIVRT